MDKSSILLIFYLLSNSANSQSIDSTFILEGTINIDTGIIKLISAGEDAYYPKSIGYPEAKINHGKFSFKGPVSFPYAFRLLSTSGCDYLSDYFFVEPGKQTIQCNVDSSRKIPEISNKSMNELRDEYVRGINSLNLASISYDEKQKTTESFLFRYCEEHPNSYVALWNLIIRFNYKYDPILDTIYHLFSDSIKKSYAGIVLSEKLDAARSTAIGKVFPTLTLLDIKNNPVVFSGMNAGHKYTLVDFWFSHCNPCLSEFPGYKKIYDLYKKKGFEIIGISIDRKAAKNDWKRVIKDKELNWIQYLDEDGKLASKLSINSFPTNFLLDKNGVIIKKGLDPMELKKFLAAQ